MEVLFFLKIFFPQYVNPQVRTLLTQNKEEGFLYTFIGVPGHVSNNTLFDLILVYSYLVQSLNLHKKREGDNKKHYKSTSKDIGVLDSVTLPSSSTEYLWNNLTEKQTE